MNLFTFLSNKAWRIALFTVLTLLVFGGVKAKLQIKVPGPSVPAVKGCNPRAVKFEDIIGRTNPHFAIYAKGQKVIISAADNGKTSIKIGNETQVGDYTNYYIYGGDLDAGVQGNIDIYMDGGSVGAIIGGGYACESSAPVTGNVSIDIRGGSVGYVAGGGEKYDYTYGCTVTGNVDISLKNCEYRGYKYINNNSTENINGEVTVRDFSTHTYGTGIQWGSTNAGFKAYMIQTAPKTLSIDWRIPNSGYIKDGVDMTWDELTVSALSIVINNGKIRMASCQSKYSNLGTWCNHSVELPHKLGTEVRYKNDAGHALACSVCGNSVHVAHNFILLPSTSKTATGATHTWECSVCHQTKQEECTPAWGYNDANSHALKCTKCNHIFEAKNHAGSSQASKLNQDYHIRKCDHSDCKADFKEAHKWIKLQNSFCEGCGETHTHSYKNGECIICGYTHQCSASDYVSGSSKCSVCGKGCSHTNKTFLPEQSNTLAGHFYKCNTCQQTLRAEAHNIVDDPNNGHICRNTIGCTFSCDHKNTSRTKKTDTRTYNAPDSVISYKITREEIYCTNCDQDIACAITDAEGNVYYMTSLDAAFQYAIAHKMNNATIKLLKESVIRERTYAKLNGLSMTLDMNNCDIKFSISNTAYAQLNVIGGTLNVVNTNNIVKAEDGTQTKQYANIYNANSTNSIAVGDNANVRLDGVHVSNLTIGSQKFTFADVEVERLTINADTYPLSIEDNGQVTIFQCLSTLNRSFKTILPEGYIITQYQKGGSWDRLYDHTSMNSVAAGPRYNSNLLRIEPCEDHYVSVGISYTEAGHNGTCTYCAKSVTNVAHRMTQSGAKIDDQYHKKRCENCGYQADQENHTFDQQTGLCSDDLCKASAIVELHEQDGEKPIHFASFEAAWDACHLGRADTIVLLKDYAVTKPLNVQYGLYEYGENESANVTAYPIVVGDGLTLSYTGTGYPLVIKDASYDTEFVMRLNPGLKCTSNWSEGTIKATPIVGAVFNASKTEVSVCAAHDCKYKLMYDEENNVKTYHEATCKLCKIVFDENHYYKQGTSCIHCGTERIIVANGTIEGQTEPIALYGSLNEAMAHAASYSAENGTPVTIHALTDLIVDNNGSLNSIASAITLDTPGADVILDATDPNDPSHEFEIKCYCGDMINVEDGKLTILSGKYHSASNAISLAYNSKGKVQLMGGTYLCSDQYSSQNNDGICSSYIRRNGESEGAGVKAMIAPGYYMILSNLNHRHNSPELKSGDIVSYKSPATVISASGTVYKCNHTTLGSEVSAQELTCTADGHPSYQVCEQCGAAIQKNGNGNISSVTTIEDITTTAPGHQYVKSGDGDNATYVCNRELTHLDGTTYACNQPARAVTASCVVVDRTSGDTIKSTLACNEAGFENFFSAWNTRGSYVTYANSLGDQDTYNQDIKIITTYTLHTDIDLTGVVGQHLIDMCIFHDYVIDLNGHNLNLGDYCIRSNNWSYYPGQDALTIRDSKKDDKTFTGNLNLNGTYGYEPYKPKYSGEKDLILEDVTVKTNTLLYNAKTTYMYGRSGLVLSKNDSLYFGYISMEPDCFLEGHGISDINFDYSTAQSKDISKALHNVIYYEVDDNGQMTEIKGKGSSTCDTDVRICLPNGKPVGPNNIWRATMPYGMVDHTFEGQISDDGQYHYGHCTVCGYEAYGEHKYYNHTCVSCLHKAEAYAVVDGVTTDYTSLATAIDSVMGKKATIVLKKDAKANFVISSENTDLTLNLNNHTITSDGSYTISLDGAKMTITDALEGQGKIVNNYEYGSALVISNKATNSLTIKGGNFQANDGALLLKSTQVNVEGCPAVKIFNGKFSSIRTGSTACNVMDLLAEGCYFRAYEDDRLIETAQTFQKANSTSGYSYLEDVYAYGKDLLLTGNEDIDIDNAAEATVDQYQALITEALNNNSVNSFGRTDIEYIADLHDLNIIADLQQATTDAGITKLVSQDDDIQAYLEARLVKTTVESVQVVGSADGETIQALTRMTFEVQPYACIMIDGKTVSVAISKDMIQDAVTLRLPVDSRYDASVLQVYRTDEDETRALLGTYEVLSETDKDGKVSKYIEVTSDKLTTFDYLATTTFTLMDAKEYDEKSTKTMESVSYVRTFANPNSWDALYIPMSIKPTTDCDIAEIYTFGNMVDTNENGKVDEEDELVLIVDKLSTADVTEANTPYVIRSSSTEEKTFSSSNNVLYKVEEYVGSCSTTRTKYTFRGSYEEKDFSGSAEGYTLQDGNVKLETGNLAPQRWFIEITSKVAGTNPEVEQAQASAIRIFTIGEDMDRETAIRLLQGDTVDVWQNGKRYTLDGRRAAGSTQGIQIINNKKVIKK